MIEESIPHNPLGGRTLIVDAQDGDVADLSKPGAGAKDLAAIGLRALKKGELNDKSIKDIVASTSKILK